MNRATPVPAEITVTVGADGAFEGSMLVRPDDPIFAGHYPDFPIYPGVCLAEVAHQAAFAALDRTDIRLAEIESSRFQHPVSPGDHLLISGRITGLRCAVDIHVEGRESVRAARIRLAFRNEIA